MGETGNGGTGNTVVEEDEACTGEVTKNEDCVGGTAPLQLGRQISKDSSPHKAFVIISANSDATVLF
jgi:hypothetical protein